MSYVWEENIRKNALNYADNMVEQNPQTDQWEKTLLRYVSCPMSQNAATLHHFTFRPFYNK